MQTLRVQPFSSSKGAIRCSRGRLNVRAEAIAIPDGFSKVMLQMVQEEPSFSDPIHRVRIIYCACICESRLALAATVCW